MLENMPSVHKIPYSLTLYIIAKYFLAFICFFVTICVLSNVIRFAYTDQK